MLWSKPHGPGTCKINNTGGPCYTTSSPAIDPNGTYVYSYGLDGFVHKHRITDGVEITTGGWPQLAALKPFDEKGSSALALATVGSHVYLYVVHGGYPGDNGDYQGHVTTIDLATGAQTVFNATCSDVHAHLGPKPANPSPPPPLPYCTLPRNAIWSRPGVIYDESLGRLFVSTGNGTYTGNTDGHDWSESVLAINPDGTSSAQGPNDSYTPQNFQSLDSGDADIGSTTIAVIPSLPGSSVAHLGVQGGKDGKLRLVNLANLANLAGAPAPGHLGGEVGSIINIPQGGGLFSQPAVWRNPADDAVWVFVANGSGLSGLRMQVGAGRQSFAERAVVDSAGRHVAADGRQRAVLRGEWRVARGQSHVGHHPLEQPGTGRGLRPLAEPARAERRRVLHRWQRPSGRIRAGASNGGTRFRRGRGPEKRHRLEIRSRPDFAVEDERPYRDQYRDHFQRSYLVQLRRMPISMATAIRTLSGRTRQAARPPSG